MAEIGLIASVLQVADIGARLSLKVKDFCRDAVNADNAITFISKDISHTSAILRELGQCLEKDHEDHLCSENAFRITSTIVDECRIVSEEIDQALMDKMTRMSLDGKLGQPELAILERSTWLFLQPKIKLLCDNLDKLKSTLHLMLDVIIYARLVAEKIAPTSAVDQQRVIIEHLLRLDIEQTHKHERLKVMIEEKSLEIVREVMTLAKNGTPASPLRSSPTPTESLACATIGPIRLLQANDMKTRTIEHYCALIGNLLGCVDLEDYIIDSKVRTRIRNDVVEIHKRETRYLEGIYGAEDLQDAMSSKYWKLADMAVERYTLARAMHNQSPSSLSENAENTAASGVAKVVETTGTKLSDAKMSSTCPGNSVFEGPKEAGTENLPYVLRKEMEALREEPSVPEVSITRSSASAKRVNSERLEAIDSTNSISRNLSQPDSATRERSKYEILCYRYKKNQQRKRAMAEKRDSDARQALCSIISVLFLFYIYVRLLGALFAGCSYLFNDLLIYYLYTIPTNSLKR